MSYENDILDAPIPNDNPTAVRQALWVGAIIGLGLHLLCWAIYWALSQFATHPYGFLWNLIPFALTGIWTTIYVWAVRHKHQSTYRLVLFAFPIAFLSMLAFLFFHENGNWQEVMNKPHIHGYPALSMLVIEWVVIFSWIWIHQKGTTVMGIILLNLSLAFILVNS